MLSDFSWQKVTDVKLEVHPAAVMFVREWQFLLLTQAGLNKTEFVKNESLHIL